MKSKTKSIVLLSPGFPRGLDDTQCLPFIQMLCRSLRDEFSEGNIILISFHYPFTNEKYEWEGITVYSLGGANRKFINKLITWLKALRLINKLSKTNEIVGILSFWATDCFFVGSFIAQKLKLKHFTWVLGQDAKKGNKYLNLVKPKASQLIAHSSLTASRLEENYSLQNVQVIEGGFHPTGLSSFAETKREIDVIGVGSLLELKNYSLFIALIEKLKINHENIRALIIGEGPLYNELNRLIKEKGLQNNIQLTGTLKHREVLIKMSQSKIFLHTSNYESGNVTVVSEAIYAGCSAVCFDHHIQSRHKNIFISKNNEGLFEHLKLLLHTKLDHQIGELTVDMKASARKFITLFSH